MRSPVVSPTSASSRPCPPAEFLRTGRVSPEASPLVRHVEQDAEGELRYVEHVPSRAAVVRCQ